MRTWAVIAGSLLAGAALFLVAVAAAPRLDGGSSANGGMTLVSSCGHRLYARLGSGSEMPAADADRSFDYAVGETIDLVFPAGPYYAIIEQMGAHFTYPLGRPPIVEDGQPCAERPFLLRARATGEGEGRFRVWVPDDAPASDPQASPLPAS